MASAADGLSRGFFCNIQETRCAVSVLRHLGRSAHTCCRRVLIFVDSMVGLGALSKGRSSSTPLLRLCRQAAACCLAFGLIPMYRYIASEHNPADGPSRGLRVGAAPETVEAHRDRDPRNLAPAAEEPLPEVTSEAIARELWKKGRLCSGFAGG